jgi:hypothetical protein
MAGYNHRSVIFAKQPLIAWQIYKNIPYIEISPVDVVSLEVGSLQAGKLNELHSVTLATVA